MDLKSLVEMDGYDTDKDVYFRRVYERHFSPLRQKAVTLLEIGIYRGGSLLLWRDYFSKGKIIGLDLHPVTLDDPSGRVITYQGDQQDTVLLDRVAAEQAPSGFDIIIDDGSHLGEITRKTFVHLFPRHLRTDGLYVIEDWGAGYWPDFPDGRAFSESTAGLGSLPPTGQGEGGPRRFPCHQWGLAGFVHQLVDEVAMNDITLQGRGVGSFRHSWIKEMCLTHGQAVIRKEDHHPIE